MHLVTYFITKLILVFYIILYYIILYYIVISLGIKAANQWFRLFKVKTNGMTRT